MTSPVDPLGGRSEAGLRLSRRSLIAAAAIVATIGSTSVARAFSNSSKKLPKGFGNGPTDRAPGPGAGPGPENRASPDAHCFCRGTRLLTPTGDVAIEDLSTGDVLVTQCGAERAIRRIGTRSIARDGAAAWPQHALPVRIARGALAPELPRRDLYLSREHLLFLNGVLIPAGNLVNGTTIRAVVPTGDVVHYLHIELDGHDVLLAEGAPCESLLVAPERRMRFDNYDAYVAMYGPATAATMAPCAPIAAFNGGRSELASRLRSALTPIVDLRRPMDVVRDNLEARALVWKAA